MSQLVFCASECKLSQLSGLYTTYLNINCSVYRTVVIITDFIGFIIVLTADIKAVLLRSIH